MLVQKLEAYVAKNEQEKADKQAMLAFIEKNSSDVLTRKNKIAHITVSGFVVNETFDKVLMAYHNIYQTYAWTGGHADGVDDLLAVAIKEAKEETGLKTIQPFSFDIASLEILPVFGHRKNGEFVSTHLHLNVSYILIGKEDEDVRAKLDENSDVRWIAFESLRDYCKEPKMIPIYEKLITQVKVKN